MNGVRINETVTSTARALQDSVHSFIDIYSRQHPFEIPVSQVLRFEKDRGFKHGQPTEDRSTIYHFQRASCGGRRPLGARLPSPGIGQIVTTSISSPILPRHRSFSSFSAQAEKKKPQLPRRPPIPPRRPPVSSYGRPDIEAPEDDTLAKIASTTGKEYQNKSNNQQEQDRKRQNQIDKLDTPWYNFLRDVSGRLTLAEIEIKILIQDTHAVRSNTLREMEEIYNKFKIQVDILKLQVHDRSKYIDTLPKEIRSKRKEAAKKGRQDYIFELHSEATGLGPFRRRVDHATYQLEVLRRQLADLKYTIDWSAWHQERLEFQLKETIAATRQLKSANELHNHLRDIVDELSKDQAKIDEKLDKLRNNLVATGSSLSRSRRQRYLRITITLATEVHYFGHNFPLECHLWRKLDRFALTELRFPEAIDHVVPEFEIDPLLARWQENTYKINRTISKMLGDNRMPTIKRRWRPTFGPKDSLVDSTMEFRKMYRAFLVGGLTLLNPKLSSQFGRLKYAAFFPFETLLVAVNDFMVTSRASIDKLLKQVENHDKRSENYERSERIRNVSARLELAANDATSFKRDFIPLYHELGFEMISRFIRNDYNDPNLEKIFSEMNARAKTEHNEARTSELKEAQAFDQLSQPSFYRDHMSANRLMDPVKLRGNDTLYPLTKNYPIEFISLEARVHQVLKAIPVGTIVGFDMLGGSIDESQNPLYLSIATTEKVFLIDWDWATKDLTSSLTEFLENPDIVKVVHNTETVTRYLSSRKIHSRGVVSIDKQPLEEHVESSSRLTSTGHWNPPGRGSSSWNTFFEFITDLAFLSTYNLWTFLSAMTPENVSPLQQDLRKNVLQARERLDRKIRASHDSSLVFGPVKWDHVGVFFELKRAHNVETKRLNSLTTFTRLQAAKDLSVRGEQNFSNGLAAYYMFTTFNEELSTIGTMLEMDNVASHILEVAERFDLTLHPEDLGRLKDAPKDEISWTKAINERSVVMEGETQNVKTRKKRARGKRAKTKSKDKQDKSLGSQSGTKRVTIGPQSKVELEAKAGKKIQLKKPSKIGRQKGNRGSINPVRSVLLKGAGKPRNVLSGPIVRPVQSRSNKIKLQKAQNVPEPVKHRIIGRKTQNGRFPSRKVDLSKSQARNQAGTAPSMTPHDPISHPKRETERSPKIAEGAETADPKTTRSQNGGTKDSKKDTIKQVPLLRHIPRLNDLTMKWFSSEKKEKSG